MASYYSRMRRILHNATGHFTQSENTPVQVAPAPTVTGRATPMPGSLVRASDVYADLTQWLPTPGAPAANTRPYTGRRNVSDVNRMPRTLTRQRVS
ncbi:hypothetical protein [Verrucosispora sp. NA02020]|uniref:hypothetical protein n=1 Tax=Verrucosispora sp. NA02020 TaxID=2742132 RepID=UPI001591D72E|nr:hypothetical protein [Verrucosispora sp. NA02020]QKW15314.1 hypothetical protein HUT12_22845 [Verrucosispora sp. NA02020]